MRKPIDLPVVLLLAGLALRTLTPAGYMPGSLAGGTPFVLCPNGAPGTSYFLERGSGGHAHHDQHGGADESAETPWEFCPFGAAFSASAPASEPAPALFTPDIYFATVAPQVILRPAQSRPFRARGPPLIAS